MTSPIDYPPIEDDDVRAAYMYWRNMPDAEQRFNAWLAGVKAEAWDSGALVYENQLVQSGYHYAEHENPHRSTSASSVPETEPK